jgi:hypothetical protein
MPFSKKKDQFLAETGFTYQEFKERFIQWYRNYSLSLYSGFDSGDEWGVVEVADEIQANPAQYQQYLEYFVEQVNSLTIEDLDYTTL